MFVKLFVVPSTKMARKQRYLEEDSAERAEELLEQGSVASDRTAQDHGQEALRQTPNIREKENIGEVLLSSGGVNLSNGIFACNLAINQIMQYLAALSVGMMPPRPL